MDEVIRKQDADLDLGSFMLINILAFLANLHREKIDLVEKERQQRSFWHWFKLLNSKGVRTALTSGAHMVVAKIAKRSLVS